MGLPMGETDVRMVNPLQMAYVGDAVHALFVRTRLFAGGENVGRMHRRASRSVSAVDQSHALGRIEPLLTEQEADIVRRGRNAHAHHAAPKHADPSDYSRATALEALLGYLYLSGQTQRLAQLLAAAHAQDGRTEETHG